jgi:beta-lactamase superfamily II metal-dependent hydrolase
MDEKEGRDLTTIMCGEVGMPGFPIYTLRSECQWISNPEVIMQTLHVAQTFVSKATCCGTAQISVVYFGSANRVFRHNIMVKETTAVGIEIDFLAVGEGEKSGDAIALRYGNLFSSNRDDQTVVIIDGGTKDSGARLVQHVQKYYKTNVVDYVFLTHPDGDHASGLTEVIANMAVRALVMHQPWNHTKDICDLFKDGRITDNSLEIRIRKSLEAAHELEQLAIASKVPVVEAFQGGSTTDGVIHVLGPTKAYYQSLLPGFRRTPEAKQSFGSSFFQKATDAVTTVLESMRFETLTDTGETSAENNSSMILLISIEGEQFLFTGDAGIPALTSAADYCAWNGISLTNLSILQVPHHGSKRNVGPTILNRIIAKNAIISASAGGAPKHPAKKVTNALIRRGSMVFATQGQNIRFYRNAIPHPDWSGALTPVPFYDFVEE